VGGGLLVRNRKSICSKKTQSQQGENDSSGSSGSEGGAAQQQTEEDKRIARLAAEKKGKSAEKKGNAEEKKAKAAEKKVKAEEKKAKAKETEDEESEERTEAAEPELRTLVVTGMTTKHFKFNFNKKESKNQRTFRFKREGDHRILVEVPKIFDKYVKPGDMLWSVRYQKKNVEKNESLD